MKKLNENKNAKVVTFDFDNTIIKSYEESNDGEDTIYRFGGVNPQIIARIKKFKQAGTTVLVVTARNNDLEVPESSVQSMLNKFKIQVDGVFYTNGEKKARKLHELGSSLHYDDDPAERQAIEAYRKLHPTDIVVKNPDDLLKDIDEVAKGLILTNDNKIIIVQRSDSEEWDAAGGHLMEGEEANYAFYREVLEEMSLKVKRIQYLSTTETTWKKKDLLVHYFLGQIPYSSEELDGIVQLQWELADYLVGDLEEVQRTMSNQTTQNLKNVLSLYAEESLILEAAVQYSGKNATKKRRLVFEVEKFQQMMINGHEEDKKTYLTTGGNTSTGATGLKRVKNMPRSKSAPPIGEEKKPKNRKKIKIKVRAASGSNNGD